MDKNQLLNDILNLVDSNPYNNVDIAPIIIKYSEGKSFIEQRSLRVEIESILKDLKNAKDIDYNQNAIGITSSLGNRFDTFSAIIKSSYNRVKKQNEENVRPVLHFGEFKGNFVGGDAIAVNQISEAKISDEKKDKNKIFWQIIIPLAVAIIASLVVYLITKK
jgi:hypothetical protein